MDEQQLLKKVEEAAKKGVSKVSFRQSLLSLLPGVIVIVLLMIFVVPKINYLQNGFKNIFGIDKPVEGHDLTLSNSGFLGYTAVDFQEAILGDASKLSKIEVYTQKVSDASTVQDTGLFNLAVFSKNQLITYDGTAVYTVDLSGLSNSYIEVNNENKVVTLYIPHAVLDNININEEDIHFGDTEKGLLALGDIKLTAEKIYEIQKGARNKMQEKLDQDNIIETADRFAKLTVWELYSPIIKSVAKNYSLEIEFKD